VYLPRRGDTVGLTVRTHDGQVEGSRPLVVVVAAYALLLVAWIFGNPPGASPDEWSHYLRAVSIGQGQLVGVKTGPEGALSFLGPSPPAGFSEQQYRDALRWTGENVRRVHVPARLTNAWFGCSQFDASVPARCLDRDAGTWPPMVGMSPSERFLNTAVYQPLPYLAPAVVSRIDASPNQLMWLMRSLTALLCLILLATAVLSVWQPGVGSVPLVGILVAITPMEIFLASSLNPSGLEIASAVAFAAALFRLARQDEPPRWVWVSLGTTGAILALSRTPGPLWVILDVAIFLALVGFARSRALLRSHRGWSISAIALVGTGIALNRLWDGLYGPHLVFDPTPFRAAIAEGWRQLPGVLLHQVGVFDYGEFFLPSLAYTTWNALVVGLIAIALLVGTRRERIVLAGSAAAALALPVLLVATTMRHTGFPLAGRYVLPFSVVVPILAGEILVRRYDHLRMLGAQRLILPFAMGVATLQFVGWWADARRFAVGAQGAWWFVDKAQWSPPAGWWPWLILASGGALLLVGVDIVQPSRFTRVLPQELRGSTRHGFDSMHMPRDREAQSEETTPRAPSRTRDAHGPPP
jgi:Predicted membrane protein (DUF2142)